jgi:DNA-binding transcriptional ArsR family regulator
LTRDPGPVFAALADPTRRWMVETLLHEGSASVPELTSALPITRQAVAKHLATLSDAGLIERAPGGGREVNYRLRARALEPATIWLRRTEAAWDERLPRLKRAVEHGTGRSGRARPGSRSRSVRG